MRRGLAALWLLAVLAALLHLGWRLHEGVGLRTDLMALLPRDEADPSLQRINDRVTRALSARVAVLVGHRTRAGARAAAALVERRFAAVADPLGAPDAAGLAGLGALYVPVRAGLLAAEDRQRLLDGDGAALARRALSVVFGPAGLADARLLRRDPFLLLPAFLTALPLPSSRLALDDGRLTVTDGDIIWVVIALRLRGDPYSLDVQGAVETAFAAARAALPDVEILHAGAVFFAAAGAHDAIADMSLLGGISTLGTVLLVLLVFRAIAPLLWNLLAIGVGMAVGASVSLAVFDDLHVLAVLLGLSLIGIAVDYGLYYCVEVFAPGQRAASARLARVMPGITLGLLTTAVGYATFLLAPFPGLRQVALFSVVGLIAAFATVVLWLPLLDRRTPPRHGAWMLWATLLIWRARRVRGAALAVLVIVALFGATRFTVEDDVRRMQTLAPGLAGEQARMQRIAGFTIGTQFFTVRAADEETALQREETLIERLRPLRRAGALRDARAPADFVPSAARQADNRALRRSRLEEPMLAAHLDRLGLPREPTPDLAPEPAPEPTSDLTLAMLPPDGPLASMLADLILPDPDGVAHVVMLDDLRDPAAVRAAAAGLAGIDFVDPASDFSRLLARYRLRAMALLAVSAALMLPLLALRYGGRGALRVMLPATASIVLTPLIRAAFGAGFTFFDAMALVLVLSVAVDYAVFCAEADAPYRPVALLGVALAMISTMLSFGPLARSGVAAVQAVGATMLLGVALAFLLAPLAGRRLDGDA